MVYITEDLIRRRAEHNECQILSLEEVSLHQQDIEKIEHIDKWCRDLKILYLQNNLIPRIGEILDGLLSRVSVSKMFSRSFILENLGRLKKLEYLNLALNNIEVIENLEGCESLCKLDLTVNFVARLSSVQTLKDNVHLRELFLVGNPCTQFEGYRDFVLASLPQLKSLDGTHVTRSERIRASQGLEEVRRRVSEQEEEYLKRRAVEKEEEHRKGKGDETGSQETEGDIGSPALEDKQELKETTESDEERREKEFWNTPCPFTPESRLETHRHLEENKRTKDRSKEKKAKPPRTLITADGRVLNVNEPKLGFSLTEDDDNNRIILDLSVYRHMDTSLMDVDVQPMYIRVTIKGKIFQLLLPSEVKPDSSTAKRSQTTGHLLINMPKALGEIKAPKAAARPYRDDHRQRKSPDDKKREKNVPERLEVDASKVLDLANIVPRHNATEGPLEATPWQQIPVPSEDFVDDFDVPPLI
ncbi:dynein axonemal assembly factor 11 isoform X3 [Entelurus aequoreus]|uniref:dynein axonemal assembly factor 11 isoform X3 n=1 Tax=Entelurus aequoreus TaxID=161455 RepID=UPI002B1D2B5F|nr:dynein axonemal assembly factor 11 isoform X3 [Entelurus aequoreus]